MEAATQESGGTKAERSWHFIAALSLLIAIAILSLIAGLQLRRAAWDYTDGAHFEGDINNAFFWSQQCTKCGLFHLYDAVEKETIADPGRKIDYPPLRLAAVNAWGQWAQRKYPNATVSLWGIMENQLLFSRDWSPDTLALLRRCDPGLGWILVVCALIYLYFALMPSYKRIE